MNELKNCLLMHFRRWILRRVCSDSVLWDVVTGLRGADDGAGKLALTSRLRWYASGGRNILGSGGIAYAVRSSLLKKEDANSLLHSGNVNPHYAMHQRLAFNALSKIFPDNGEIDCKNCSAGSSVAFSKLLIWHYLTVTLHTPVPPGI